MKKEFNNKPLKMTKMMKRNFKTLKNVIFVIKNILMKILKFEITVILLVIIEDLLIKNVI